MAKLLDEVKASTVQVDKSDSVVVYLNSTPGCPMDVLHIGLDFDGNMFVTLLQPGEALKTLVDERPFHRKKMAQD